MKHFNAKEILTHAQRALKYIGMWPEMNPSVSYNILGLLTLNCVNCTFILFTTKSVQSIMNGDYLNGSYGFCWTMVAVHESSKVLCLITNKAAFQEILTSLEDPALLYHDDDFDIYLQDQVALSRKVFNVLVIFCISTGLVFSLSEYAFGYHIGPPLFPVETDFNHLPSYISIWVFFIASIMLCAFIIGVFEGLVATFLSLAVAQLKILQQEIIHSTDGYPSDSNLTKEDILYYDQIVNQRLSKCIKRHNAIERFIVSINYKFRTLLLIQYCVTIGVLGIIGFNLVFAEVGSPAFLSSIFVLTGAIIQMFATCYHSNEIILESEKVRDACYFSNWTECGPSVRKTLFILMERTKRPFYLTIGKFSIISLETFVIVLKTSMSYFTVLKTLYGDSELN